MTLLHPDLEAACQLVQRLAVAGDRALDAASGLPPEQACRLIRLGLACHRLADHASRRLLTPLPASTPAHLPANLPAHLQAKVPAHMPGHLAVSFRAPAVAG